MVSYDHAAEVLSDEALGLFSDLVRMHLAAESARRSFLELAVLGGNGPILRCPGGEQRARVDSASLEDLAQFGLLRRRRVAKGQHRIDITSQGVHFYRWYMREMGKPVEQVEEVVRSLVDSSRFAAAQPGASTHLAEAFELLWSDDTSEQVVSEVGGHLRSALMDAVAAKTGDVSLREKPADALKEWLTSAEVSDRQADVLSAVVELVRVTLRMDQRLDHVRDEKDKGQPDMTWPEVRRAVFLTAVVCYEIFEL